MPLPVIADVFRVTLNWTQTTGSISAHNVMHFENAGGTSTDVYNDINAHVTAAMWDFVVATGRVSSVSVLPLDGSSATTVFSTASPSKWSGAGTGSDWIPQGCGVVTWQTAERGRSRRGRTYLPWVAEGEQAAGVLADVAACQTAWTNFLTAMNLTDTIPVVASYKLASTRSVSAFLVRSFLKTQRRRAAG